MSEKYIKYDTAKKYLDEACKLIGSNGGIRMKIAFEQEPTVSVTLCKDCGNYNPHHSLPVGYCDNNGEPVSPTDGCVWEVEDE